MGHSAVSTQKLGLLLSTTKRFQTTNARQPECFTVFALVQLRHCGQLRGRQSYKGSRKVLLSQFTIKV